MPADAGAPPSNAVGVVLAAGRSSRFPGTQPKQLLEYAGEPLVRRVVRRALASRLARVLVVTGHRAPEVEAALEGLDVEIVRNIHFVDGQGSSVVAGLARLREHDPPCGAAVFIPADLPHLETATIDRVLATWEESAAPIVVPSYGGRRGAPVLFDRRLFDELATIEGDTGGRQLFPAHEDEIVEVVLASEEPLLDLDSEDDLRRLGPRRP